MFDYNLPFTPFVRIMMTHTYLCAWALFVCEMTFPQPQTTHERHRDVIIADTELYFITTINGCLFVCLHCPFGNENLWMTWLHMCACGLVHLNSSFVCMKGSQTAIISAQMTFHRLSLIFLFLLLLLFWPVVALLLFTLHIPVDFAFCHNSEWKRKLTTNRSDKRHAADGRQRH